MNIIESVSFKSIAIAVHIIVPLFPKPSTNMHKLMHKKNERLMIEIPQWKDFQDKYSCHNTAIHKKIFNLLTTAFSSKRIESGHLLAKYLPIDVAAWISTLLKKWSTCRNHVK
jgi:hypothetical protein